MKTYTSTGRNAREKSMSKYNPFCFDVDSCLGKKHLPVNPLDRNKFSSARNLSKKQKKKRIARFIENLPNKMIRKMQKIEHL